MPVQRYEIFCNSQPPCSARATHRCCLCRCKDTNFFAIHNDDASISANDVVVYAGAKIRNFLQFTTSAFSSPVASLLFMPVQRYEIFCNSQQYSVRPKLPRCCLCRCKDTKFFAIHNFRTAPHFFSRVVYAGAKIRNFLQFTTKPNIVVTSL